MIEYTKDELTEDIVQDAFDYKFDFKGKEKDLETHLIDNIYDISTNCKWGDISKIQRQYLVPFGKGKIIADVMLWHKDGTGTVIEVKTTNSNRNSILSAIGQVLSYGFKINIMLGCMPRLVIVIDKAHEDIFETIKFYNLPISLLVIDGNRAIYLV